MIAEAYKRGIQKIFELDGHVYAFGSTTIDRCQSVLERAKFRKHKGGIKMHTLYDVEAQVTAFVHITEVKVHDSKASSTNRISKMSMVSMVQENRIILIFKPIHFCGQ